MRALLEMLTLLLGAIPFTLAQVKAHAHAQAHEVRSPADVLSNLERDATSLEARDDDSYGGKDDHSGNGGWNGGPYQYKGYGSQDSDDGYGNGGKGESTSTIIVIETWEGTYGMSTVAAAGEHKTTIVNTMTNSALAATVSVSKGSGQQGGQASWVVQNGF
jgi:hypothetical protein